MKIVVALGGNAIERPGGRNTYQEQLMNVRNACESLVKIIEQGNQVVITHGNGPQVGNLAIQQELSKELPKYPLDVLVSMTQGQIGYMIQREMHNLLAKKGIRKRVVTVLTQTLVSKDDPAFSRPTKPVGPFYSEREVQSQKFNYARVMHEGKYYYRRVVPSPDPLKIIEGQTISNMIESGDIVIASGGGGIPVVQEENGELTGVEAVIDKDLAAERLAESVGAERLLILTNVDYVMLNYGKKDEKKIERMTAKEARDYLQQGHFHQGSMAPKVLACVRFVEWGGVDAKIASLENAISALEGKSGTTVTL